MLKDAQAREVCDEKLMGDRLQHPAKGADAPTTPRWRRQIAAPAGTQYNVGCLGYHCSLWGPAGTGTARGRRQTRFVFLPCGPAGACPRL